MEQKPVATNESGGGSKSHNEDGSNEDENIRGTCSCSQKLSSLYHGTWPVERALWNGQQTELINQQSISTSVHNDVASVMSFSSSVSTGVGCAASEQSLQRQRRLGAKVDVVYSLLGMLLGGAEGCEDMSATLLSMSSSVDSCLAMRQSGCLPLLVQLIHAPGQDPRTREGAAQALHNVVHASVEEGISRREVQVLRLLEQLRDYCQMIRTTLQTGQLLDDSEKHPSSIIAALMKLSFDEAHRLTMCQLGGLHAIAELNEMDHTAHGSDCDDQNCTTLRRYAGMALTNLTFGDSNNKALLCSFREFMKALVAQLHSPNDDLRQVTASVLRNLSWRADSNSKQILKELGAVTGLTKAAMEGRKETTLKSILSALWNLSAHCSTNKVDICAVEGALAFLVDMLNYEAPSKTLAIVENAGGILRNVSSHIAVKEDYRTILREKGCLQILLRQLRSPSLTVVSNACGALWNLSARCPQDQRLLWDLGAVPMLRSLVHSKHKMISMGSSAALRNLLGSRPGSHSFIHLDSSLRGLRLYTLPTLIARRQRALEQEINVDLAETCDNIEPSTSPTKNDKYTFHVDRESRVYHMLNSHLGSSDIRLNVVSRIESAEPIHSVTSSRSDSNLERGAISKASLTNVPVKQQSLSMYPSTSFNAAMSTESSLKGGHPDKNVSRYESSLPESQSTVSISDVRCTTSDVSWSSTEDVVPGHSEIKDIFTESSVTETDEIKSECISAQTEASTFKESCFQNSINRSATSSPMFPMTRNNSDATYEGDASDQPVDYSKKYVERNASHQNNLLGDTDINRSPKKEFNDHSPEVDIFGDYAETDLDQPTDYSLRYAEDDTDEDEKQNSEYFAGSERVFIHGDSVKTYCTEGTPYETPFNFSTATSMSDLRVEDCKEGDVPKRTSKKATDISHKEDDAAFKPKTVQRSNSHQSMMNKESKIPKNRSELSSGLMSPEKPVNYCDEGTPGCFSRVSSLSSLSSALVPPNNSSGKIVAEESQTADNGTTIITNGRQNIEAAQSCKPSIIAETNGQAEVKNDTRVVDKEGKMVTFGGEDHYAEQTPLMFSRCSSLGSLSGFEQHSFHDDRSSIVSDFSRRTSGMVSPSELPDSPTQTVPPSPRQNKPQADFVSRTRDEVNRPPSRHLPSGRSHPTKRSVFEDDIAAFKEESTPIDFSAATSLSSLTIDDEPKIVKDPKLKENSGNAVAVIPEEEEQKSPDNETTGVAETDGDQVSDVDEDDEDMLAACINIGMQNNRYRQSFRKSSPQKVAQPVSNLARYQTSSALNQIDSGAAVNSAKESPHIRKTKTSAEIVAVSDTVHVYCTEDTPANISPFGSQSNLSTLSMLSTPGDLGKVKTEFRPLVADAEAVELSDDSSNFSGEDEKILNECIQSGIPKLRQHTPPPGSSLSVFKKPELRTYKLDDRDSPSRSLESAHDDRSPVLYNPLLRSPPDVKTELSDDSSSLSEDDDDILTECIQSAMPKARQNTPPPARPLSASKKAELRTDKLILRGSSPLRPYLDNENTMMHKTHPIQTLKDKNKLSDDNSSLSDEEDIILAQCIQSGIPKARLNTPPLSAPLPILKKPEQHLQRLNSCSTPSSSPVGTAYGAKQSLSHKQLSRIAGEDEIANFATEDSPCSFSVVSGISDLTLSSVENCTAVSSHEATRQTRSGSTALNAPVKYPSKSAMRRVAGGVASLDSLQDEEVENDANLHPNVQNVLARHVLGGSGSQSPIERGVGGGTEQAEASTSGEAIDVCEDLVTANSHRSSISSLSAGSFGSVEEWEHALLELCISSAMPKTKIDGNGRKTEKRSLDVPGKSTNCEEPEVSAEDDCSICSYSSYVCKT